MTGTYKRRIEKLEEQAKPADAAYPIHHFDVEERTDAPLRECCPTCKAMGDEEYAKYEAWCKRTRGVTHVIIGKSAKNQPDPVQPAA